MKAELLDTARREILADMGALLEAAALEADASERVEAGLVAGARRAAGATRRVTRSTATGGPPSDASEFMLLAAWPLLLHHYGVALLDERAALRWRAAVSARAKVWRQPGRA